MQFIATLERINASNDNNNVPNLFIICFLYFIYLSYQIYFLPRIFFLHLFYYKDSKNIEFIKEIISDFESLQKHASQEIATWIVVSISTYEIVKKLFFFP